MRAIFASTAALLSVGAASLPQDYNKDVMLRLRFEEFVAEHRAQEEQHFGMGYHSEEGKEYRFQVFRMNMEKIEMVNSQQREYRYGINQFTDMTPEEFTQSLGFEAGRGWDEASMELQVSDPAFQAPESIDWVRKGAVTPVKNQQHCGSCWSFSTTGAMEGAFQVATGKLVALSEQQLVSCDHDGQHGCHGGMMPTAMEWAKQQEVICTEESYPYTSGDGSEASCRVHGGSGCQSAWPGHNIERVVGVQRGQQQLEEAVAGRPVSIAVDATALMQYSDGILSDCSVNHLNHGILLVGYTSESWKVKNSWSPSWGEGGYARLSKTGNGGNCLGLQDVASYIVAKGDGPSPTPSPTPTPAPAPTPTPSPEPECSGIREAICCWGSSPCNCQLGPREPGQCSEVRYVACCVVDKACACHKSQLPFLSDEASEFLANV